MLKSDKRTCPNVAVSLCATISQAFKIGELSRTCQHAAQGGDKSRQTIRSHWRVLRALSLVQGSREEITVRNRDAVQEDKLDCYCVNCGAYIHAARLLTKLSMERVRVSSITTR